MARAATARAEPAPARAPSRPRRASGPGKAAPRSRRAAAVPAPARRKPATGPARSSAPVLARLIDIATNTVIERLLRGRIWVGCVGVLLAGIVFLNVSLLQLNQEIARTATQATALDRENSRMRARVAALDSSERIQSLAERRGMVMPEPGHFRYLRARPWLDAELAMRRVVAPEPPAAPVPPAAPPAQLAQAPATPATTTPTTTTAAPQAQSPATTTPPPAPAAGPPAAVATP